MKLANTGFLRGSILPAWEVLTKVEKKLEKKHPGREDSIAISSKLIKWFPAVYNLFNGELKGKRVLDLGCGSIDSPDNSQKNTYAPWLCRALHELGTEVIGMDLGDLSEEEFEGHRLNLGKTDITTRIEPHSIDLACAFALFDSPSDLRGVDLFHRLLPQLDRIVKPDGTFVFAPTGTRYHDKTEYGRFLARTHYTDINSLEGASAR